LGLVEVKSGFGSLEVHILLGIVPSEDSEKNDSTVGRIKKSDFGVPF